MDGFHIYIIKSDKQNFYIGQTKNLIDRLRRHNSNRSSYTKGKGKWRLIVSCEVASRSEAVKIERKLKNMKNSKLAIQYLTKLVQSIPTRSGGS